ncbi:DUF2147 domain-containing protein [Devosia sp.]|uniref:DUF2147 domain-containing protein n=1 Tax=Devosia sp. TaxID=1871048 RepID=UPI001B03870A|nr:DUF2147 domain-containing protein [Devosia sp.]MBO9590535.1 DUF2147 domain-containing protein [Devosia sp.]
MFKAFAATTIALAALAAPAMAQSAANPDGVWKDKWGTTFTFSTCGDGTQLCGILNDVQGNSRTEENLAFVNKQVVSAEQTAPNKWEGQIAMNGSTAKAIVEVKDTNTLTITGCRAAILCQTLTYEKVS